MSAPDSGVPLAAGCLAMNATQGWPPLVRRNLACEPLAPGARAAGVYLPRTPLPARRRLKGIARASRRRNPVTRREGRPDQYAASAAPLVLSARRVMRSGAVPAVPVAGQSHEFGSEG